MIQGFKYNSNKPNGNESMSVKEWLLNLLLLGLFATILTIIMVVMVYTFKLTSHNTRDGGEQKKQTNLIEGVWI
jgi:heme/copper-type cytochrome/quinol oxidase subunit 2